MPGKSSSDTERCENRECYDCGTALDIRLDDHFVLTEENRPVPDREDMEFDDWFRTNWILCPDCVPGVECGRTLADRRKNDE